MRRQEFPIALTSSTYSYHYVLLMMMMVSMMSMVVLQTTIILRPFFLAIFNTFIIHFTNSYSSTCLPTYSAPGDEQYTSGHVQ